MAQNSTKFRSIRKTPEFSHGLQDYCSKRAAGAEKVFRETASGARVAVTPSIFDTAGKAIATAEPAGERKQAWQVL
jgi:hypothetical protein